ncbi:MAG: phytanoyl-CoA dioxygenase family protein [Rhodospirillaceae bacterium]|nr:phytanoyl-CoA dioxygenase family protein [Rhodospirillaceae bacterium]
MNAKPDVFHGAERHQYHQVEQDIVPHIERLDFAGYTVIEGFLPTDRNDALRNAVRDVYDRQCADFGEDNLVRIGDAGVCRSPFMEDAVFREVLTDPFLMKVMRHYFGPLFTLNVQRGVISAPNERHPASVWHREPAYQNFTTSRPISFSVIFLLDGSALENGGISILEGSHRFETLPSDRYVADHEKVVEAGPGALLVFNSALFHRGGQNVSDRARHSVVQI